MILLLFNIFFGSDRQFCDIHA